MNHTFRIVWNISLERYIVANEHAKSKQNGNSLSSLPNITETLKKTALLWLVTGCLFSSVVLADDTGTLYTNTNWFSLNGKSTINVETESHDYSLLNQDISSKYDTFNIGDSTAPGTFTYQNTTEYSGISISTGNLNVGTQGNWGIFTVSGSDSSRTATFNSDLLNVGSTDNNSTGIVQVDTYGVIKTPALNIYNGSVIVAGSGSNLDATTITIYKNGSLNLGTSTDSAGTLSTANPIFDNGEISIYASKNTGSSYTLSSAITGDSRINIETGTAYLTGDLTKFTGTTQIENGATLGVKVNSDTDNFSAYGNTINNDGAIKIDNSRNGEYRLTSDIAGEGLVDITNGIVSLTGTLSKFTGKTDIVKGATLAIASNQDLNLGSSAVDVYGVLQFGVDSDTEYGSLTTGGDVILRSGSSIALDVADTAALSNGTQLALVSTTDDGTLTDYSNNTLTDNSALYDFTETVTTGTNGKIVTTIIVDKDNSVSDIAHSSGDARGINPADVLTDWVSGSDLTDAQTKVTTALGKLTNNSDVAKAVDETFQSLESASISTVSTDMQNTTRTINNRLAVTQGMSSGDAFLANRGIWLKPIGSWVNQGEHDGMAGYDANSYGIVAGIDGNTRDDDILGLAFSYIKSDIDGKGDTATQSSNIDQYQVGLYGQKNLNIADLSVNWQADLGYNRTDSKRDVIFMGTQAIANYNSYSGHVGVGAGKTFSLSKTTQIVPSVRADYSLIRVEAYNEKGADALDLNVDSKKVDAFVTTVGSKLYHTFNNQLTASANVSIGYDLINDDTDIVSSYAGGGSSFVTEGQDLAPWVATVGAGLNYQANDTLQYSVNYDQQNRSDYANRTLSAKIKWLF